MASKVDRKTHTAPERKKEAPRTERKADTTRAQDAKKPGEGKDARDGKKPGEADNTQISREAKDGQAPGEGNGEKNQELDSMRQDIDDMKKLLDEMGKPKKEEEKKPEDLGGCCGKSHGSGDKGQQQGDINDVLLQDVMAVKAERLGQTAGNLGNNPQQQGQRGQRQAGGAGRVPGLGGANAQNPMAAGGGNARGKLQADYNQAKQSQAQIRPEVEQQVLAELGGGGAGLPGQGGTPGLQPQGPGGAQGAPQPRR